MIYGLSSYEMDSVVWDQILIKAVYISLRANVSRKGMNLSVIAPARVK